MILVIVVIVVAVILIATVDDDNYNDYDHFYDFSDITLTISVLIPFIMKITYLFSYSNTYAYVCLPTKTVVCYGNREK